MAVWYAGSCCWCWYGGRVVYKIRGSDGVVKKKRKVLRGNWRAAIT